MSSGYRRAVVLKTPKRFEGCVSREMRDGTGLVLTVDRLVYFKGVYLIGNRHPSLGLFFRAIVSSLGAVMGSDSEFRPEDHQIIGIDWIPKDDLLSCFPDRVSSYVIHTPVFWDHVALEFPNPVYIDFQNETPR